MHSMQRVELFRHSNRLRELSDRVIDLGGSADADSVQRQIGSSESCSAEYFLT